MMSLAQRVRDFRYTKGWGPDELASRAAISRTALYQIESGKTELPRAGTLRRIALALEVSMESLLGHGDAGKSGNGTHPAVTATTFATHGVIPRCWNRNSRLWLVATATAETMVKRTCRLSNWVRRNSDSGGATARG